MTPSPYRALVPSALVAAGQLRECVAAARNLEHLVASLTVGPQVLSHVIPDVAEALGEYPAVLERAIACTDERGIDLSLSEREALIGTSGQRVSELLSLLAEVAEAPIHARARLSLERKLAQVVPVLVTATAHVELLLEICQAEPAELSVYELLTSMPERGSDRPHRPIFVQGSGLDSVVSVPPRVALKILSAWVSSRPGGDAGEVALGVRNEGGGVIFTIETSVRSDLQVRLPVFFPSPHTRMVLGAALRPYRGHVSDLGLIFQTS